MTVKARNEVDFWASGSKRAKIRFNMANNPPVGKLELVIESAGADVVIAQMDAVNGWQNLFPTIESAATGIAAGTTRTQAGATALTKSQNRVDSSTSVPITIAANGTWTTATPNITMNVANSGNVQPGMAVYDNTVGGASGFLGFVSTYIGTALVLTANALHASSGSSDSLIFNAGGVLGDGVVLPASFAGQEIKVENNTANNIQVYGAGSDTINGVAAATGVSIPPGDEAIFISPAAGAWFFDAGMGSSGQLPVVVSADNVCAAGTSQPNAFQLVGDFNRVIAAVAGTSQGVALPASKGGMDIILENASGVQITVYPFIGSSDTIDGVAAATGVVMMPYSVVIFTCYSAGAWFTNGLATGYAKTATSGTVLETQQFADNLTALTGGQGSALQLTAGINTIATCPSGGGVNLPASAAGLAVTVINNGANGLLVFPLQGASDTINGQAASVGILIVPGSTATFNCTAAGAWTVQAATTTEQAYNTNSATSGTTLTAANVTGGSSNVVLNLTGTLGAGANAQLPTVAALIAALHSPAVGTSYELDIYNTSGGAFSWTVTTNAGAGTWTLTGTMTIAQNTYRRFLVKITATGGSPTATIQSMGQFAIGSGI